MCIVMLSGELATLFAQIYRVFQHKWHKIRDAISYELFCSRIGLADNVPDFIEPPNWPPLTHLILILWTTVFEGSAAAGISSED